MATRSPSPEEGLADLRTSFVWLRQETLSTLLRGSGALLWLWFGSYVTHHWDFWPGWGLPVALLILDGLCLVLLGRRSYHLAALLFVVAVFGMGVAAILSPDQRMLAPLLFTAAILSGGMLLGPRVALAMTAAVSLVMAGSQLLAATATSPPTTAIEFLLIWLAGLASVATTRSLYTTLHWTWVTSEQAIDNLGKARDYQGKLASALRQLEEANYRLERANHALSWARSEADQARRLKAEFAAHVSHELRTPINLIVGFAELMLNHRDAYGGTSLPGPYLADLNALHRNAEHLRGLIDDILDLSQLDAGEMPILKDLTDVRAIVHEVVETARQLLEQKRLSIRVEIPSDLPMLYLDRLRIRQVLLNLLNNAARFTEAGGVSIRAYRDQQEMVVEVTDTGVGIRPEHLGKLFEPFHQLDSSPTRARGGTGLGLTISKHFVELHGGRTWVRSDGVPGKGSTFSIALPIQPDDIVRGSYPGQADRRWELPTAPPQPTVVVFDDDPAIVNLFRRHLNGYQVVGATSQEQALQAAASRRAHAIITDLADAQCLSKWHQEWSQSATRTKIRILGCPMPSGRRVMRTLGLTDYLVKPVTRDALLQAVEATAPQARTILVVDDEPQMVRLLCQMLRSSARKYRLRRAYDGQQAMEVMRQGQPDLVLLDLLMPQVDGFTTLEKMKEDPVLASIPVVAVSARGAFEAISPSIARTLILIEDEPSPVSQLLRSVQAVLDSLSPAEARHDPSEQEGPANPVGSKAS